MKDFMAILFLILHSNLSLIPLFCFLRTVISNLETLRPKGLFWARDENIQMLSSVSRGFLVGRDNQWANFSLMLTVNPADIFLFQVYSRSTIAMYEICVKIIKAPNQKYINEVVLVSLLFTLDSFLKVFWCFSR